MTPLLLATADAARHVTHTLAPMDFGRLMFYLFILVLAGFLGFEVIGRVSPTLHTPLMSATNAISGISLVGSLVAASGQYSLTSSILGLIAVSAATINVVGGFRITDRMLKMFKKKDGGDGNDPRLQHCHFRSDLPRCLHPLRARPEGRSPPRPRAAACSWPRAAWRWPSSAR